MRTLRHRKPENFLAGVRRNGHGIVEEEALTRPEAADEALVMGLRLSEGVDLDTIAARFVLRSIVDWRRVDRLVASGHLWREGGRVGTSPAGRLLLDSILAEIAEPQPIASAAAPRQPASPAVSQAMPPPASAYSCSP